MNIIRHGDILLKSIKREGLKLKLIGKFSSYVIAEGETTGHRHTLTAEPQTMFEVLEDASGQRYLQMNYGGQISHQEHKTKTVMSDLYIVGREREFDYPSEQIKRVAD